MGAPCAAVPLPGGRPVPSGWMLMSQAAISAGVTGWPRFGPPAMAADETNATNIAAIDRSRVDMSHLPFAVDGPASGAVVVLVRECQDRWDCRRLTAVGHDLSARWLDVAALVPSAALQDCRPAVPLPRDAEPRKRLRQHRLLYRRRRTP